MVPDNVLYPNDSNNPLTSAWGWLINCSGMDYHTVHGAQRMTKHLVCCDFGLKVHFIFSQSDDIKLLIYLFYQIGLWFALLLMHSPFDHNSKYKATVGYHSNSQTKGKYSTSKPHTEWSDIKLVLIILCNSTWKQISKSEQSKIRAKHMYSNMMHWFGVWKWIESIWSIKMNFIKSFSIVLTQTLENKYSFN